MQHLADALLRLAVLAGAWLMAAHQLCCMLADI
jgi:hypothetical protein